MLPIVAVYSLGEMVSPCLTHILIMIDSLSLCIRTATERSEYMPFRISIYRCTHLIFAMMTILFSIVLSQMPSRNPRMQSKAYVVFAALLFMLVYYMDMSVMLFLQGCFT